ncbi:anthranilate O-methyltransferase 3-like [Phoenix dactylifera]|uniref:Anthranilate O-methyltransferase 3-like n=1 Tax=Phoenix dactylifera TaxID=42345 RepID=A0A8B9A030_PHODC|nr:anthranilate O-methyltransferase 3-like [Phoenix dactylifera]
MGMKVEQVLHMVGGAGETSYATNSRVQEKAIFEAKPIVEEALREVYKTALPESMVVADLGCSSGPNTFHVVFEAIDIVDDQSRRLGRPPPEILFFLNDLPGNDFNSIFQSLEVHEEKLKEEKQEWIPPFYVVGVPGSFYGRLFPSRSVHFFHSSYCLMWLSQVPPGVESNTGVPLNKENIYISETSPPTVVESYQEQYRRDFTTFLKSRFQELGFGGRMVLSFLGRTNKYAPSGELSQLWGLLAEALNAMVLEGILQKEKVDAFNLPFYAPSMEEVRAVIQSVGLFDLDQVEIFKSNWDPFDDSSDDRIYDNIISGENVAKSIRAVIEPVIARSFGEHILDDLFSRYAKNVARHLLEEKTKHPVFVIALKTKV